MHKYITKVYLFAVVAAFINVCMMSQTSNCNPKGVTDEYTENRSSKSAALKAAVRHF